MLPPGGILDAPGHVGAAPLRGAGSAGIEVTYAQTVSGVELVVHLSQILVKVKRRGNIALPSCIAIGKANVGQRNVAIDDLPRDRINSVRANYIRHSVADEGSVSGGGGVVLFWWSDNISMDLPRESSGGPHVDRCVIVLSL